MRESKAHRLQRREVEARTEAQRQTNKAIRAAGPINKASLETLTAEERLKRVKLKKGYSMPFHLWPQHLREKEEQALRAIKFAKQQKKS